MQVREIIQERERLDESLSSALVAVTKFLFKGNIINIIGRFAGLYTFYELGMPVYTYYSNVNEKYDELRRGNITELEYYVYQAQEISTLMTKMSELLKIKLVGLAISPFTGILRMLGKLPGVGNFFSGLAQIVSAANKTGQAAFMYSLQSDQDDPVKRALTTMTTAALVGLETFEKHYPDLVKSAYAVLDDVKTKLGEYVPSMDTITPKAGEDVPKSDIETPPTPSKPVSQGAQATQDTTTKRNRMVRISPEIIKDIDTGKLEIDYATK